MVKRFLRTIVGLGFFLIVILLVSNYRYSFFPIQSAGWSIGYQEINDPFDNWKPSQNKIFTTNWLDDLTPKTTRFLADPFVIYEDGEYFIFFEHQGEGNANIALMWSANGIDFTYKGEVLDEEYHLSFPQVFRHKGQFYMLPETRQSNQVVLYRAEDFPFNWKVHDTLIKNVSLQDPVILISDSLFLISGREENLTQYIYTADSLHGYWEKDSRFKLRRGDETRAAGNFFKIGQNWYIPFQKNNEGYGTGVALYELNIKKDIINFKKKKDSFLVKSDSIVWFNRGMHHFSLVKTPDNYFCVFDGDMNDSLKRRESAWKASLKYNYYDMVNFIKSSYSN